MDRRLNNGGVQGRFSGVSSEELERQVQFAMEAMKKGFQASPEKMDFYYEIQVELSVRFWVNSGGQRGNINNEI